MLHSETCFHTINFSALLSVGIVCAASFTAARAQESVDINFLREATETTINGKIAGHEYFDYVLRAQAGQKMQATLLVTGTNGQGSAFFNILPAGKDFGGLYTGTADDDSSAEVTFPASGKWAIRVYLAGNDKDTGKTVGYSIEVEMLATQEQPGASGAVIFQVAGVQLNDVLNVRSGPGTAHGITGALANGDQVRNLGCGDYGSARWCQIEMTTDMRERGWVNARYLTKAAGAHQPDAGGTSTIRVTFVPGTSGTNFTDSLKPGASRRYVLGARAGQQFYFRLDANGPGMSYQIFNPDKSFLLGRIAAANEYRGQLWQSGDHVVEVINRGSGTRSYQAAISIE